MKLLTVPLCISLLFFSAVSASAQKTEITITFGEQFFDALLDAVFQHAAPPEFSLAEAAARDRLDGVAMSFAPTAGSPCNEAIQLLRENAGVRTAVRFRNGEIVAPLAFRGNYNPPLIGCVPFSGLAETVIDLEFDRSAHRLIARARVRDVSLDGTGGVGGSIIARMVQSSIDKKINPIEIVRTDKVSFIVPMQNSSSVRMKATGFSHEIANGQLSVKVSYEFLKN